MPRGEPWLEKLRQGETEAAWDLLIGRYHRLISATVRHFVDGYDEVMDLFAHCCESLRADDLARLRKYASLPEGQVRFSTWLVAVVRNLVIDWFRHRDGRKRLSKLARELPPAQREAFQMVYVNGLSPGEAYELLRTQSGLEGSFGEFLNDLANAQRALAVKRPGALLSELGGHRRRPQIEEIKSSLEDETNSPSETLDQRLLQNELLARLGPALAALSAEDRLALQLYVVEGLPAEDVARLLGWKSAKTVYNHVYRALAAVRDHLKGEGLKVEDL
ncbi:MAG: sigma factor-like helix-turn-helix DNA-binding protein [Gemmatimonadales bacterium]|jgi:RNA polymerase sigma factor (sigma-70 family)